MDAGFTPKSLAVAEAIQKYRNLPIHAGDLKYTTIDVDYISAGQIIATLISNIESTQKYVSRLEKLNDKLIDGLSHGL